MKGIALGIGVLACALTVVGCSSTQTLGTSPTAPTDKKMSNQQKLALADRKVSHGEFMIGFTKFQACMEKAGYPIALEPQTDAQLKFVIPETAMRDGSYYRCYGYYWEQLDIDWQVANEDTSDTAQALRKCLVARKLEPKTRIKDLVNQLKAVGVSSEECLAPL